MIYCTDYRGNGLGNWQEIDPWNGFEYILNYTIPSSPSKATYKIGVSSSWGEDNGTVQFVNKSEDGANANANGSTVREVAVQSAAPAGVRKSALRVAPVLRSVIHTNATPKAAPDGYMADSNFGKENPEKYTYTLHKSNNWTHTFEGLEEYDPDGNPYVYYVVETGCSETNYWIDSYKEEGGTFTITNKTVKNGPVTVTKSVSGTTLPTDFYITNDYNNERFDLTNATGSNPYTWTIQDVPLDTIITFTEHNLQVNGYSLNVNGTATTEDSATAVATWSGTSATAELVNDYTQKTGSLQINKRVMKNNDVDTDDAGIYYFNVYKAEDVVEGALKEDAVPVASNVAITVTAGEGSKTVNDLPLGGYYVFELTGEGGDPITNGKATFVGKFYTVTGAENPAMVAEETTVEVTVTNTYETVTVTGTKTWNIDSNDLPADPTLVLTRVSEKPGAEGETVTVENGQPVWAAATGSKVRTYTYSDLPKYDDEGYAYTYSVAETSFTLNGVEYTVTKNGTTYTVSPDDGKVRVEADGNNISNTELTSKGITKTWGNVKEDSKLTSITYRITRGIVIGSETTDDTTFNSAPTSTVTVTRTQTGYKVTDSYGTVLKEDDAQTIDWGYQWTGLETFGSFKTASAGDQIPGAEEGEKYANDQYLRGAFAYNMEETRFVYDETTYTVEKDEANSSKYVVKVNGEVTDKWITQREGNAFTNTLNDTWIKVKKIWKENDHEVAVPLTGIQSIQVTLYRNGKTSGEAIDASTRKPPVSEAAPFTLTVDSNATADNDVIINEVYEWTISGLDKYYLNDSGALAQYEYYIVETEPAGWTISGYNNGELDENDKPKNQTAQEAKVMEDGTITVTNSCYTYTLPSTGGAGTTAFTIGGVSILALAALWFIWDQRRRYNAIDDR